MKIRVAAALAACVPLCGCAGQFEPFSIVNPYVANSPVGVASGQLVVSTGRDGRQVVTQPDPLTNLTNARIDAQKTADAYLGAVETAAYAKNIGFAALLFFAGDSIFLRSIKGQKPTNRLVTGTAVAGGVAYTANSALLPNVRTTIYLNGIDALDCATGQSTPYLIDRDDYARYLNNIPAFSTSDEASAAHDGEDVARTRLTDVQALLSNTAITADDRTRLQAAQTHLQTALASADAALGDSQTLPGDLQELRSRIAAAGPALRGDIRRIQHAVNQQLSTTELSATDMRSLITGFAPLTLPLPTPPGPVTGGSPATAQHNLNAFVDFKESGPGKGKKAAAAKPDVGPTVTAAEAAARDLGTSTGALVALMIPAKSFLKVVVEHEHAAHVGTCDVAQVVTFLVTPLGQPTLAPSGKFAILVLAPGTPQAQVDGGDDIKATVITTQAPQTGMSGHYEVDLTATDKLDQATARRVITITAGANSQSVVLTIPPKAS